MKPTLSGKTLVAVAAMAVAVSVAMPAAASRGPDLPNLVPLPAEDIRIGRTDDGQGPALRFGVPQANKSTFAFDLVGVGDDPIGDSYAAQQCTAWATHRVCLERTEVGRFSWHATHGHYHLENFALYELRKFRPNGSVNFKPKGLVATSPKISFCLMDIEQDRSADNPLYAAPHPLYLTCLAGAGFQGISPGWRDVYGPGLDGQQIPLAEVRDGTYALVVYTDPDGNLLETDKDDNTSVVGLVLSGGVSRFEIICRSEPGGRVCDPVESPGA